MRSGVLERPEPHSKAWAKAWAKARAGQAIRFAHVPSSLGPLLVAASDKGICRVHFDADEAGLQAAFPDARIFAADAEAQGWARQVAGLVDAPASLDIDVPLDLRGSAFQLSVWAALQDIPVGQTRSYADIARNIARPSAVRAVGSACGANPAALLVPCHRVLRSDGSLGGYAWGLERKRALLDMEMRHRL